MKARVESLKGALADGNLKAAEAVATDAQVAADRFVESLRKEGVLRCSRYGYDGASVAAVAERLTISTRTTPSLKRCLRRRLAGYGEMGYRIQMPGTVTPMGF